MSESFISDGCREQYVRLHEKGFGHGGAYWAPVIAGLVMDYGLQTGLDYGCGQGLLQKAAKNFFDQMGRHQDFQFEGWDPGDPGAGDPPNGPFDIVACTDVLEHVEPELVPFVVGRMCAMTGKVLFLVINLLMSSAFLPDGRNAHLCIRSPDWWADVVKAGSDWDRVVRMEIGKGCKDLVLLCVKKEAA